MTYVGQAEVGHGVVLHVGQQETQRAGGRTDQAQALLRGDYEAARKACGRFVEIFGRENFVIELMDHGLEEQKRIIAKRLDPGKLKDFIDREYKEGKILK